MNTLTLWHGGRDLEFNHREFKSSKKGKWEHGPGLYLTTHYDRAYKYSKGGGKTYLIEFNEGNEIRDIELSLTDVYEFINDNLIKRKSLEITDCIKENSNKQSISAAYFLNIIISFDALTLPKTNILNEFLVSNKVDYAVIKNYGGHAETVYVIFNNKVIEKVKHIKAKYVQSSQWEMPVVFSSNHHIKNTI